MGIDPPMSAADIPAVTEKVKEKLGHWKADQKSQTEKNIAKAQKEIERLDAEAADSSPATPTTNGHAKKAEDGNVIANAVETIKDAASGVVERLTGTSLEDKE